MFRSTYPAGGGRKLLWQGASATTPLSDTDNPNAFQGPSGDGTGTGKAGVSGQSAADLAMPAAGVKPGAPPAPEMSGMEDVIGIGDRKADPVQISPDVAKNAADFLAGKSGDSPVKVNLAYVDSGAAIQNTLERISTMLPGQDVQSHDSTRALALGFGFMHLRAYFLRAGAVWVRWKAAKGAKAYPAAAQQPIRSLV